MNEWVNLSGEVANQSAPINETTEQLTFNEIIDTNESGTVDEMFNVNQTEDENIDLEGSEELTQENNGPQSGDTPRSPFHSLN